MDEPNDSERLRELRDEITSELESRSDVTGFEFEPTEDPGVHVSVEEHDTVELYHVTAERLPDGTVETYWTLIGERHGD